MARSLRLEYAGGLYHITSRGNRKENIYDDDNDRSYFLALLGEVCSQYNWQCYGYCLMSNHYHLLIETIQGNLSKGMRQLNGVYSQKYNRQHNRVGHVFQGRYHAIIVEKQNYLLELSRYIVLNPVRAKMVSAATDWPWSNHSATLGLRPGYPWLNTTWVLSQFSETKHDAIALYAEFVNDGIRTSSPLKEVKNQVFLGSDAFVERGLNMIEPDIDLDEIPKIQRRMVPRSLQDISETRHTRNHAIVAAFNSGGYTMKQIGNYFGISYSMVSKIIKKSPFKT